MASKALTQFALDNLKPEDRDYEESDGRSGLRVLVRKTGNKSWIVRTRVDGQTIKATLGKVEAISLKDARKLASKVILKASEGVNVNAEKRRAEEARRGARDSTVKAIFEDYLVRACGMTRDADGKAVFSGTDRTAPQRLDAFERLVYPRIGDIQVDELKRSKIVGMLDEIADENGPVMADRTLAYVRRALNWHASRTDDFRSPIVKGMARTKSKERAGKRVLADDEIRDIWAVCEMGGKDLPDAFCRFQRCLFLAASRRTEAAAMSWFEMESLARDDFKGDGWTCPAERMKGKLDHLVPVTAALREMIGEQPKDWRKRPYVFSTTGGKRPFSGYSKSKAALDRELGALRKREGREPMRPWAMQRDVRRTARTLLTRAGVPSEIAERVVAHEIPGVEGVYNRYDYVAEKHDALTKLAALLDRIVHPQANVIALRE